MGGANLLIWEERWLWIGLSFLLALIASWWIWAMDRYAADDSWWAALLRKPALPLLWESIRWLYALGLPAMVLLWRHALTERGLGLQPLRFLDSTLPAQARLANWNDWARDLGLTFAVLLLALLIRHLSGLPLPTRRRWDRGAAAAFGEALIHQVHWAFYREPFILRWGAATGSWGGLALVALEAALNPLRWRDLRDAGRRPLLLWRGFLAVVALLLFLMTENLILMVLADALLTWLGEGGPRWVKLRHLASAPPLPHEERSTA